MCAHVRSGQKDIMLAPYNSFVLIFFTTLKIVYTFINWLEELCYQNNLGNVHRYEHKLRVRLCLGRGTVDIKIIIVYTWSNSKRF